jgi:hypothetical protein
MTRKKEPNSVNTRFTKQTDRLCPVISNPLAGEGPVEYSRRRRSEYMFCQNKPKWSSQTMKKPNEPKLSSVSGLSSLDSF